MSEANRSDERAVLQAASRLVVTARAMVGSYAEGMCPINTGQVSELLLRTNTELVEHRFRSRTKGVAMPAIGGGSVIAVDVGGLRTDVMFTIRHELAHVLAGEASEPTYLTAEDTMSHSERVADLFAVADLTPGGWMKRVVGGKKFLYAVLDVKQAYRELTEGWSEQRLWDRAKLRVLLYREFGI